MRQYDPQRMNEEEGELRKEGGKGVGDLSLFKILIFGSSLIFQLNFDFLLKLT